MSLNRQKALYQPWNEEEFNGDFLVQQMNQMEKWMYRSLLQASFFCATRPYLPDDDKQLFRLAGCDDAKTWGKHKVKVLKMFQKFTEGDLRLLSQKRIKIDWHREQERRETLSKKGLKGAEAKKAKVAGASAQDVPQLEHRLSTNKQTEQTNRTEPNLTEQDRTDMSLKSNITDKCRLVLGLRLNPQSSDWSEITALGRVYDHQAIVDAFETWATPHRGEVLPYPLSEFLKTADGLLAGIFSVGEDQELNLFSAKLYNLADQAFTGKYLFTLKDLVKKNGQDEVFASYKEFLGNLDDFKKSSAVRDYCEGGAVAVIGARKLRKEQDEEKKQTLDRLKEEARTEGAKEVAEILRKRQEEESLIEETL